MNHRVAILGGSGFIGRYIVKRLAERGDVVAVGGRYAAQAKFLKLKGDVGQVGLINIGIENERLLPAFLAGNDTVINCVGILRESGRQRFDLLHHTAPARLARLAREAGAARFIHVSAAIVFGPEDQFFNRFAALAMVSPVLPLIGGGLTRFQPVYVGDVADAAVRCLDDPASAGRTYELGGPKVYTFRALMELLLEEIRRKRLLIDIPFSIASLQARLMAILPNPPLTPDQVELLKRDNVVSSGALTLATLGITPTAVEAILPTYLDRFRRGGWYERRRMPMTRAD